MTLLDVERKGEKVVDRGPPATRKRCLVAKVIREMLPIDPDLIEIIAIFERRIS